MIVNKTYKNHIKMIMGDFNSKKYEKTINGIENILQLVDREKCLSTLLNMYSESIRALSTKNQKYDDLLDSVEGVLRLSNKMKPDNTNTILALGNYYGTIKQYQKANECFDMVIKIDPNNIEAIRNKGLTYECKREYREALKYFLKYKYFLCKRIKCPPQDEHNYHDQLPYAYQKIVQMASRSQKKYIVLGYAKRLFELNRGKLIDLFIFVESLNLCGKYELAKSVCEKSLQQLNKSSRQEMAYFSLQLTDMLINKRTLSAFQTQVYAYNCVTELINKYDSIHIKDNENLHKAFNIIVENSYKHHNEIKYENKQPNILYKYMSLEKFDRICDVFINEYLFLAKPENFNDPFDPVIKKTDSYIKHKKLFENIKIGCLSENYDNILMWSHYTDRHNGICIGYDVSQIFLNSDFNINNTALKKCIYADNIYVDDNLIIDENLKHIGNALNQMSFLDMYCIKHKSWEYETEYRIIAKDTDNKIYLPIKEIYFGLDMNNKFQQLIIDLVKNLPLCKKIKIYKMQKRADIFYLDKEEIKL